MIFKIISIFPQMFSSYFANSIIKRAQDKKIIDIKIYNLRDWASDKHKSVDDSPYGGGAGMVMRADIIMRAIMSLNNQKKMKKNLKRKIVLLSAKGKKWHQELAKKYAKLDELILICGRYEGVDERVKYFIDEEISIGDYVLTGGELGAMVMVDSITRLLPGVLGNMTSLNFESHNEPGILEYPQYTRPEILSLPISKHLLKKNIKNRKIRVPKILLSGDHQKISIWREKKRKIIKNKIDR